MFVRLQLNCTVTLRGMGHVQPMLPHNIYVSTKYITLCWQHVSHLLHIVPHIEVQHHGRVDPPQQACVNYMLIFKGYTNR